MDIGTYTFEFLLCLLPAQPRMMDDAKRGAWPKAARLLLWSSLSIGQERQQTLQKPSYLLINIE